VQAALLAAVHSCAPELGVPEVASVHRWRYALVEKLAATPYGFDPALALAVCGDWRLGPRVECAWQSGDTLGAALPGLLRDTTQA
jgi:renalase